jgi:hypothetical protein
MLAKPGNEKAAGLLRAASFFFDPIIFSRYRQEL